MVEKEEIKIRKMKMRDNIIKSKNNNRLSLQVIFNSLHQDSFKYIDLNNIHPRYNVLVSDRGIHFSEDVNTVYCSIGEISGDDLLFVRNVAHREYN